MSRMLRILIGAGLVGYGFYSGNAWFYLGLIPLVTGLVNWCPMESMMGGCKDGECGCSTTSNVETSSCCSSDAKDNTSCCSSSQPEEVKSSCCATPEEQIKEFEQSQTDTTTIKILGIGCANCVALKKVVEEAIKNIDGNFEVLKIEDAQEIMNYQIMSTPGLVINDEVKSVGKLLSIEEVTALINGSTKVLGEDVKTKCC